MALFVIGSGPSSYALILGLRKQGFKDKIIVFTGENNDAIIPKKLFNVKNI